MTLGLVVSRFGDFLAEWSSAPSDPVPAPHGLARIFEHQGHRLVALALLARADGDSAQSEREVILRYSVDSAKKAGMDITPAERLALNDYLFGFRPSRTQLKTAIQHMRDDSKEDIVALVSAARAIVDADGERRPRELEFLNGLSRDLAAL
jgi:tellurite resistance protein